MRVSMGVTVAVNASGKAYLDFVAVWHYWYRVVVYRVAEEVNQRVGTVGWSTPTLFLASGAKRGTQP